MTASPALYSVGLAIWTHLDSCSMLDNWSKALKAEPTRIHIIACVDAMNKVVECALICFVSNLLLNAL